MANDTNEIDWDVFDNVLKIEPELRSNYLDCVYEHDSAKRAEMELLIQHAEQSGPLDQSIEELLPDITSVVAENLLDPALCEHIGDWRRIDNIGSGGMGRVYRAERARGSFRQLCALKLIRWEMQEPWLVEQFRTERQILAQLEHPNIARLIDGGITDHGTPYFTTELIDGTPITDYVVTQQLDIKAILELFLQILDAVDYAHRKRVIHRDLKPSNILVDTYGRVKLLDFGIATVKESQGSVLAYNGGMGTLLYSSPEQLNGEQISATTDIWALGVLLYELITGLHPFSITTHSDSTKQNILNANAAKFPSRSKTTKQKINKDLKCIILNALKKNPDLRYRSASQIRTDIKSFLECKPILARSGKWHYVLGKFIVRYQSPIVLICLCLTGLMGALAYHRITLEKEYERVIAVTEKLYNHKRFLLEIIGSEKIALTTDSIFQAEKSIHYELSSNPKLQSDLYHIFGELFIKKLDMENAEKYLRKAIDIRSDSGIGSAIASSQYLLASLLIKDYRMGEASELLGESYEFMPANEQLADMLYQAARFQFQKANFNKAIKLLSSAADIELKHQRTLSFQYIRIIVNLIESHYKNGDLPEANNLHNGLLSTLENYHCPCNSRDTAKLVEYLIGYSLYKKNDGHFLWSEDILKRTQAIKDRYNITPNEGSKFEL